MTQAIQASWDVKASVECIEAHRIDRGSTIDRVRFDQSDEAGAASKTARRFYFKQDLLERAVANPVREVAFDFAALHVPCVGFA